MLRPFDRSRLPLNFQCTYCTALALLPPLPPLPPLPSSPPPTVTLFEATTAEHMLAVREIFLEYAQSLSVDLCFQDFDSELAQLPGEYAAPRGSLLLAMVNQEVAG